MLTAEGRSIVSLFTSEETIWSRSAVLAMRTSPSPLDPAEFPEILATDVELGSVPCRIYSPPRASGARELSPLVIYVHGGCWVMGDLDSEDASCRAIAESSDSTVLSIGYRLAPEHPFPAALDDIDSVLGNLAGLCDEFGLEATALRACGASAGANLLMAALLREPAWRNRVSSIALICPLVRAVHTSPSAQEFARGYALDLDLLNLTTGMYCTSEEQPGPFVTVDAQPRLLAGLPPTLVITAGCDPLRDEGEELARLMSEQGIRTTAIRHVGVPHEFFLISEAGSSGAHAIKAVATHFLQ